MDALCKLSSTYDPQNSIDFIVHVPSPELVTEIYETLPPSSPMIKWLIHMVDGPFSASKDGLPAGYEACPKDFFVDLYKHSIARENKYIRRQLCDYHEHVDKVEIGTTSGSHNDQASLGQIFLQAQKVPTALTQLSRDDPCERSPWGSSAIFSGQNLERQHARTPGRQLSSASPSAYPAEGHRQPLSSPYADPPRYNSSSTFDRYGTYGPNPAEHTARSDPRSGRYR